MTSIDYFADRDFDVDLMDPSYQQFANYDFAELDGEVQMQYGQADITNPLWTPYEATSSGHDLRCVAADPVMDRTSY